MKHKIKALVVILALSVAPLTNAKNNINDSMDRMLGIDNATISNGFVSRNGPNGSYSASFGGFSTSSPIRKISVISYTAPDFKAGCAGIDFQFGSFSLISRKQVEQMLQTIMANARGYAVKLAVDKICPSCLSVARQLEEQATAWNMSLKNTCEISEAAVNWLADGIEGAVKHKETMEGINSGGRYDAAEATTKDKGRGNRGVGDNTPQKNAQYANALLNTMISAHVFDKSKTNLEFDTEAYKSPKSTKTADQQFFEMAMSLLGTDITKTKDNSQDEHINAIWSFDDFTNGTKSRHQQYVLECTAFDISDVESCQKVQHGKNTWQGTYRYILEIILGDQEDSDFENGTLRIKNDSVVTYLRDKYNKTAVEDTQNSQPNASKNTISKRRQAFISNTSVLDQTALGILYEVATQDNAAITIAIAEAIAHAGAEQMSAEMVGALVQVVHTAYNANLENGKKRAILSPSQSKKLDELKKQAEEVLKNKHESYAKVDKLYQAMTAKLPKTTNYLNNPNIDLSNYR